MKIMILLVRKFAWDENSPEINKPKALENYFLTKKEQKMKLTKLFLSTFVLLSFCASASNIKTAEHKGESILPKLFGDKPIYKLKIEGKENMIEVFFNGVRVYKDDTLTSSYITYPINNLIATGKNELKVRLIAMQSINYTFKSRSKFKITFMVKSEGKEHVLSVLQYTHKEIEKFAGTTPSGTYSIDNQLKPSNEGDLTIGEVKTSPMPMYRTQKVKGLIFTQNISVPTPFPRWKFLDSENILDTNFDDLSMDKYQKLKASPKIQALYDQYTLLHSAFKAKNVHKILDMIEERSKEMDIAWYSQQGFNRKEMQEDLNEMLNNNDWEFVGFDRDKHYFFIEDNNKIGYLNAIAFNKKNVELRTSYRFSFRYSKGKWILTR